MATTQRWLDGYLRAWETNGADDVRALFADDGRARRFVEWYMPLAKTPEE